jgi:hypothetical protein
VEAEVGQVFRFEPYADHLQFVLSDPEAAAGQLDGDTWVKSLEEWRIAVEPHAISVATARYDYVPVVFQLLAHAPAGAVLDDADHAVEADIELASGRLTIAGAVQLPGEADLLQLDPGRYRLRISYNQTDYRPVRSTEAEPGDYLEYRIIMWPVQVPSGVTVLKQGQTPWACWQAVAAPWPGPSSWSG